MVTIRKASPPGFSPGRAAVVAAGLGALLVTLAALIRMSPDSAAEGSLMELVRSLEAPGLRGFMESVSRFTDQPGLVLAPVITVVFLATGRVRDAAIFLTIVLIIGAAVFVADFALGEIAGRGRPLPFETRPSYPSGHTSGSTWFFIFVMFLIARSTAPDIGKGWVTGVLGTLVVLVGLSRVFLYRHWPLDVVGGYALGVLAALVAIWLFETLRRSCTPAELPRTVRNGIANRKLGIAT